MSSSPTERTPLLSSSPKPGPSLKWTDYLSILPPLFINIFLSNFENTIAASVQNPIGSSFDAGKHVAWIATSYLIVSTAVQPLYGRFSGLFGRTPVFVFALGTFTLGCAACGFSNNIIQLVAARAFCGIGGGGLIVVSQIIAYDFVPVKVRGLYQATTNSMYGLGGALGASVGGVVSEALGWRYAFFLQIPICLASLFIYVSCARPRLTSLGIHKMPESIGLSDIDVWGSILLMSVITALLLALNLGGNELPWRHPLILTSFGMSAVLLILFVLHENRCRLPVLPLSLFRDKQLVPHIGANFFGAASVFATFYLLPTFFQIKLQNSVSSTSTKLIYPTLSAPIGSIFAGIAINSASTPLNMTRVLSIFGAFVLCVGTSVDLGLQFEDAVGMPLIWYIAHICWTNLGMGILFPASLIDMSSRNNGHDQAITTSLIFLTRQLGSVFGISASQSAFQNVLAQSLRRFVHDPADNVLWEVRDNLEKISSLPWPQKLKALSCVAYGLQAAFLVCAICGMLTLTSILVTLWRRPKGSDNTDTSQVTPEAEESSSSS